MWPSMVVNSLTPIHVQFDMICNQPFKTWKFRRFRHSPPKIRPVAPCSAAISQRNGPHLGLTLKVVLFRSYPIKHFLYRKQGCKYMLSCIYIHCMLHAGQVMLRFLMCGLCMVDFSCPLCFLKLVEKALPRLIVSQIVSLWSSHPGEKRAVEVPHRNLCRWAYIRFIIYSVLATWWWNFMSEARECSEKQISTPER